MSSGVSISVEDVSWISGAIEDCSSNNIVGEYAVDEVSEVIGSVPDVDDISKLGEEVDNEEGDDPDCRVNVSEVD